jgi:hypothetical protein
VHDWKIELVTSFFDLLYSIGLRRGSEARICWTPSKRRIFEIRSFYQALSSSAGFSFSWKSIWRSKALEGCLSFLFFSTAAFRENLDPGYNLRKRQVIVIDWCCMRKKSEKSIDHLLLP